MTNVEDLENTSSCHVWWNKNNNEPTAGCFFKHGQYGDTVMSIDFVGNLYCEELVVETIGCGSPPLWIWSNSGSVTTPLVSFRKYYGAGSEKVKIEHDGEIKIFDSKKVENVELDDGEIKLLKDKMLRTKNSVQKYGIIYDSTDERTKYYHDDTEFISIKYDSTWSASSRYRMDLKANVVVVGDAAQQGNKVCGIFPDLNDGGLSFRADIPNGSPSDFLSLAIRSNENPSSGNPYYDTPIIKFHLGDANETQYAFHFDNRGVMNWANYATNANPVNGDVWFSKTGSDFALNVYMNGATRSFTF